jgi:hypothetical protein
MTGAKIEIYIKFTQLYAKLVIFVYNLNIIAAGTGMHPLFRCGVAKLVNDPAFPQFDVARVALIR